jgi:hypothetical protein
MQEILIPEELAIKKPKKELLNIINERTFDDRVLFEVQSDFHDIKVVENEVGKFLHYCETYQAGFINTDFYKGNLPYINYFLIPAIIMTYYVVIGGWVLKYIVDFVCGSSALTAQDGYFTSFITSQISFLLFTEIETITMK